MASAHPNAAFGWEEVDRAEEPPDYFLSVSGVRCAVEVTSVTEKMPVKPRTQERIRIWESAQKLVTAAQKEAVALGFLRGKYAVDVRPVDDFERVRPEIRRNILHYLKRTAGCATADEEPLHSGRGETWEIRKIAPAGAAIYPTLASTKWEGEAQEELSLLLAERADHKAQLLAHVAEPRILLILDRYYLGSAATWQEAAKVLQQCAAFILVARVTHDGETQVLSGREPGA